MNFVKEENKIVDDYIKKYLYTSTEKKKIINQIKRYELASFVLPVYESVDNILKLKYDLSVLEIKHKKLIEFLKTLSKEELKFVFYIFIKHKDMAFIIKNICEEKTYYRKMNILIDKILFHIKEVENECQN